jgi:endonuclease/exonuclease/phosphatase family metal-dependent hydrolase
MPDTLSIMTYNIRGALYEDGQNSWSFREPLNIRLLQQRAPDLIGFQEVHQENFSILQASLVGYAHIAGTPYNDDPPFQFPAIAWKSSRLRLLDTGGFWLSETPDRHSRSWDTNCIRSATWVKLEWVDAKTTFLHLNTHLDHISELARVEGAKLICRFLDQVKMPLIVTGDFNCPPDSATYRQFLENGFIDAYTAVGKTSSRWTYHGYQGSAYIPHQLDYDRIDWILLRDWDTQVTVTGCIIVEDAQPPLYPSDHYPVMATIAR